MIDFRTLESSVVKFGHVNLAKSIGKEIETIGSESLVIELSGQKSDDVLAKCRDLFENREAHKKRLIPYVKEAKSEALTLFNSLDLKTKPQRLEELHIA